MLDKETIDTIFVQYEAPNGVIYQIMKGHCLKLFYGSLYVQYHFAQYKTNTNTTSPAKWTKEEFLDWELESHTGQFDKNQVNNIIGSLLTANVTSASVATASTSLTPSQLLNNFVKFKQSGDISMVTFKHNEEWILW